MQKASSLFGNQYSISLFGCKVRKIPAERLDFLLVIARHEASDKSESLLDCFVPRNDVKVRTQ